MKPSHRHLRMDTPPHGNAHHRDPVHLAGLLLVAALLVLIMPGKASANCSENRGGAGTVTFSLPSTITVPVNVAPGTIIYTSPTVTPSRSQTLTCSGTTNSGIVNNVGPQPSGNDTLFPTGIPGLSYRILHPDTASPLHAYPNEPIPQGTLQFTVASALQLVATGSIANGSQLSGTLAQWNIDRCRMFRFGQFAFCFRNLPAQPVEIYSTTTVRFIAPACSVTTNPTTVTLPPVLSSQFTGNGSTAATTPFSVQLNCSNVSSLSITLQTNNPVTGATGVIASPTGTGYAQGVAVQLLDQNSQPVHFGTPISVGGSQNGSVSIPFFARYYQTGSVSGGQVTATATYTLNYQ